MKKLFALTAIFALIFTACEEPPNDDDAEIILPNLTIRNESSFDLTNVKFSGISFTAAGSNDLPRSTQSVKQLTANDMNKAGYITFTRKDIGIACRTEAITVSDQDYTFTFFDGRVVEELANGGNKNTLSQITFLSQITVERNGMAVAKNDNVNLGESAINYSTQIELTIKNTGVGKLLFGVNEPVKISEAEVDIFSVIQPPSNEIASNSSLTFKININPKEIKNYTAMVTITSNDKSGDYKFSINATGRLPKPIASVFYGDNEISQNGTIDAGDLFITQSKIITVTLKNTGEEVLTIDTVGITITGADAAVFAKTTNPVSNISAGVQTSFEISCTPVRQGDNSATLTIPTNDNSRNPIVAYLRIRAVQPIYYNVSFNTDGGEPAPAPQTILQGNTVNAPGAITKTGYAFVGWYKEAGLINPWNFSGDTVTGNITLYAKWELLVVPGANLTAKLAWLQINALSGGKYTVEINTNESIVPQTLSYDGKSNISITLIGIGSTRTISLSSNGSMFTVATGITLVLDNNVTLNGRSGNTGSLVNVNNGGTLLMNQGAKITGNRYTSTSAGGGGVSSNGTFTMNGGEISGNSTGSYGGGVFTNGTFTMSGGEISGNSTGSYGGGVHNNGGTFTMNGGTINGNQASSINSYGGGVCNIAGTITIKGGKISGNIANYGGGVTNTGTFNMYDGEITGNTASRSRLTAAVGGGVYNSGVFRMGGGIIYGSNAMQSLQNSAADGGAALYHNPISLPNAEYGIFNGNTFNRTGNMNTTNTTIRIVNGVLQTS
jgi:uncharacterized repeat protein (TIGR02543 family)